MKVLEDFKKEIQSGFVIVDFYAPWCGDCKRIEPILNEIENEFKIYKINIDENDSISSEFAIRRIPTLVFFQDGKEVGDRIVEPKSKQEILDAIKSAKSK